MSNGAPHRYSCTPLIKVGAMLAETRALLAQWDEAQAPRDNLQRALVENWLGKASHRRAEAMLAVFRQRFLTDPSIVPGLRALQQPGTPPGALDLLFYFHTAQADALLHDVAIDLVWVLRQEGREQVESARVAAAIDDWVRTHNDGARWSAETLERAAQGALTALRDFGLLEGPRKGPTKRIVRPYLPIEMFAYVAFWLYRRHRSARRLIDDPEWRLFLVEPITVESLLIEAHQERLLTFMAAGSTFSLEFPTDDPGGYARALAERASRAA